MPLGSLALAGESVPVFSPTYRNAKPVFTGMTLVGISYRVGVSQIRHLVPDVLELEDEPLMTSTFVQYGMSSVGAYSEFVHQVEVTYKGEKFDYSLILILDNEAAIFAGREVYGYPKVNGNATIQMFNGGRVVLGGAERPVGRKVVEFEFIPEQLALGLPKQEKWTLNLRSIPSPILGEPPSIHEFVPVAMDMKYDEVWLGKGHVSFPRSSALDPWANIDVLKYEGSFLATNVSAELRIRDKNFKL